MNYSRTTFSAVKTGLHHINKFNVDAYKKYLGDNKEYNKKFKEILTVFQYAYKAMESDIKRKDDADYLWNVLHRMLDAMDELRVNTTICKPVLEEKHYNRIKNEVIPVIYEDMYALAFALQKDDRVNFMEQILK